MGHSKFSEETVAEYVEQRFPKGSRDPSVEELLGDLEYREVIEWVVKAVHDGSLHPVETGVERISGKSDFKVHAWMVTVLHHHEIIHDHQKRDDLVVPKGKEKK